MKPDIASFEWKDALLDAVTLFEELKIGYALIGGVAAMYYGRARFTEDVDFVAAGDHEKVLAANPKAMQNHHFDPSCTWKLHHVSGAEVDLWKDEFADGIARRAKKVRLAKHTVQVAEVHDLIAMKLRADRPQDDYDISEILRNGVIESEKIRHLVTAEQFQRFQAIQTRIAKKRT